MRQKLITKEVEKRLLKYPLYSQEEVADKAVLVKFFNGPATWIVCEAERRGDNDWMFFGWVDLGFGGEWGYFTFDFNRVSCKKVETALKFLANWKKEALERELFYLYPTLLREDAQLIRYVHASKKSEHPDIPVYDVIVAGGEDADKVLRFLKRFIVNSEKWEGQQFAKREYLVNHVENFDDVRFSINKKRI